MYNPDDMTSELPEARRASTEHFTGSASGVRRFMAPGRVNLIGEHTDYSEGFVMPAAIDLRAVVTIQPRRDRRIRLRSALLAGVVEYDRLPETPAHNWTDYPIGVARSLVRAGIDIPGFDLEISGDIPLGAGLSSSAAVTVSTALALLSLVGRNMTTIEIVRICQQAENEFVGAMSGIMDPFAACAGRRDHALMLDCRSLAVRWLPIPENVRLLIANSMVKHELANGEYNLRRKQVEDGVRILRSRNPRIDSLRDAGIADLERSRREMPETVFRRCRHVISENKRVELAADALDRRDLHAFGGLMLEAHQSIRYDFEASCPELDLLVDLAGSLPGCYGSRMTGGGFGGCTVSLVEASQADAFRQSLHNSYQNRTGIDAPIYLCRAADGAGPVR